MLSSLCRNTIRQETLKVSHPFFSFSVLFFEINIRHSCTNYWQLPVFTATQLCLLHQLFLDIMEMLIV